MFFVEVDGFEAAAESLGMACDTLACTALLCSRYGGCNVNEYREGESGIAKFCVMQAGCMQLNRLTD